MRPARVLVTGGTDGIGLEVVRLLAARGASVVATGRRDGPDLPGVAWVRADQSDPGAAARTIAAACRDDLDAAILCAGTGTAATDGVEGAGAIRATLRVNLAASVLIAHALAPVLLARGGTLALVGSVARRGMGALPSYSASKAGLHGFARALGEEWRGRASVAMLHPGPTRTGMQGKAGMEVGRAARLFVPAPLMARMLLAEVDRAHGRRAPRLATLGHGAAGRRWIAERIGVGRLARSARARPS